MFSRNLLISYLGDSKNFDHIKRVMQSADLYLFTKESNKFNHLPNKSITKQTLYEDNHFALKLIYWKNNIETEFSNSKYTSHVYKVLYGSLKDQTSHATNFVSENQIIGHQGVLEQFLTNNGHTINKQNYTLSLHYFQKKCKI